MNGNINSLKIVVIIFILITGTNIPLFSQSVYAQTTPSTTFLSTFGTIGSGNGQFSAVPLGIALDSSGNIYVVDTGNDRVQIFDSSGNFLTTFGTEGTGNGQFNFPRGIAFDSTDNIYVVDSSNDRVQKFFRFTGFSSVAFLSTFGSFGSADGQFNFPLDIAFDSSDNIYVPDLDNNRVQIFDSSGNFISKFGSPGTGNGQFDGLRGIAIDSSGNINVVESTNNRIQIFDSSGNFLSTFGSTGSADGQFNSPQGIALDSSGNIYVTDSSNNRVQIFDSSGNFLSKFGSSGTGNGQFDFPNGIALDSSGNIYVVDSFNYRVQKFTPFEAATITPPVITSPTDGATITTDTVTLTGTADANATIQVFDGVTSLGTATADTNGDWTFTTFTLSDGAHTFTVTANDGINTSDASSAVTITIGTAAPSTVFLSTFGSSGTGNGQFDSPRGIAFDSVGNIFVADNNNDRIQKFDSSGTFLSTFGSTGSGNGQLDDPQGIALDSSGNIYVADDNNNRIQIFDSSGTFLSTFGSTGTDNGQFNDPRGIALDSSGNIYVADSANDRVQIFDSSGNFLSTFGSTGTANGQFNSPRGIAFDSTGNIFVADTANDRVQIFDSSGNFLSKFGTTGSADGQLDFPQSIALDSSDNIYVVETSNDRVQIFDSSGNFLSKFGTEGTANGQFDAPFGIALDSSNNIYVSDSTNHRIQKFTPFENVTIPPPTSPVFLSTFGTTGSANGQFNLPTGIALDSSGNIYVVDLFNSRVQIFDSSGNFLSTFGITGSANGQFDFPEDIALDSSGNIYVTEANNDRVQIFDSSGNFLSTFGNFCWISNTDFRCVDPDGAGPLELGDGQFNLPVGIALDSSGKIYVADTNNSRVQIFDSSGNFLSKFGTSGSGNGQFTSPSHITFDSSGNIYVADTGRHRVQIFDSTTNFLSTFGTFDGFQNIDGQFNAPRDIALDSSDNIYVVDDNDRVQIFDSTGTFLSKFGEFGSADGQFNNPIGIALDSSDNIYVVDSGNDRIQKFSPFEDATITPPVITSPTDGATITTDTVTITGTTDSNATIQVFDGATSLGTATADTNGDWTFTTLTLSDGTHSFTATANDGVNTSILSTPVTITIDTTVEPPPSSFTEWTQIVIDLRNSKPQAFQDTFPISTTDEINRLLAWAGNPVAQMNNSELQEFGHLYSIMKRWNERADLQTVFTGANLADDPINLVIWSGRANVLANEFNSDLQAHEPTYVLLRIFFLERDDLRTNPVFAGALDASDPKRLYCFAANSSDVRLTPHQAFYNDNCVLTTTDITITSLSATSAMPTKLLTITATGFDSSTENLFVRFFDNNGFTLDVKVVETTSSSVKVGVPPKINLSTGAFESGTVSVQIVQQSNAGLTSNVIDGFAILDMPTYDGPAGTVYLAFLTALNNAAVTQKADIVGTVLDTPQFNQDLDTSINEYNILITKIQEVIDDPSKSIDLGSLDGESILITSSTLQEMDKIFLAYFSTFGDDIPSSIPPNTLNSNFPQAITIETCIQSVRTQAANISPTASADEVATASTEFSNGIQTCQAGKILPVIEKTAGVIGIVSALAATVGLVVAAGVAVPVAVVSGAATVAAAATAAGVVLIYKKAMVQYNMAVLTNDPDQLLLTQADILKDASLTLFSTAAGAYTKTSQTAIAAFDFISSLITINDSIPDTLNFPPPPDISSPTDGITITTDTVTLTGTSEANATIEVFDGTPSLGFVTADANGDWTFTTPTLSDGDHTFTAKATNNSGTSFASDSIMITIDTTVVTDSQITIETALGSGIPGCENTAEGCFIPSVATVGLGGTVTFSNTDSVVHTFTSLTAPPDGVFDSSLVFPGNSFEYIADTASEIPYYCELHPWMQGTLIVADGQDASTITVSTDKTSYTTGETIVVSGSVSEITGSPITIAIINPELNIVTIAETIVAPDGSFESFFLADGPLWAIFGTYTISVSYDTASSETLILFQTPT